jgi:iron complex outermembrane recepter protein
MLRPLLFSLTVVLLLALAPPLWGAEPITDAPCAALRGCVLDAQTELPLAHVNVLVENLGVGAATDESGHFVIPYLPLGHHHLHLSRMAYRTIHMDLAIDSCGVKPLDFRLMPESVQLDDLHVHGGQRASLHESILEVNQSGLQREMGGTIAQVLSAESGLATRSMGPAPARPVLRGLSGDRLLMLEDGHATGDLSGSSADHAVAIEPATTQRIEVLRGPSALKHSSAAVGGVVNVERGLIPIVVSERLSGHVSSFLGGASLSRHVAMGFNGPLNLLGNAADHSLQYHLDGSVRKSANQETPTGTLVNTALETSQWGVGFAYNSHFLRLGVGLSTYESAYGIPGGFVGAHPKGVDIDLSRQGSELKALFPLRLSSVPHLESLQIQASHSRYWHAEYESSGALGLEFGVLSNQLLASLKLGRGRFCSQAELGFQLATRDYATGGLTHTPNVLESSLAAFLNSHHDGWGLHLEQTFRFDSRLVEPAETYESALIGSIRKRRFQGGSAALSIQPNKHSHGTRRTWSPSLMLMSSWRAPGIEELFSGGPHLAAYSFEIGNPELESERGYSVEVALDVQHEFPVLGALSGQVAIFQNRFESFIFPAYTGRLSPRRADLHEYRFLGQDALFNGMDLDLQLRRSDGQGGAWEMIAAGSMVRGELTERLVPLPEIPPLHGKLLLRRLTGAWMFENSLHWAAAQSRVYTWESGGDDLLVMSEASTAGWVRCDLALEWKAVLAGRLLSLNAKVQNVFDREYYDHLSRVRSVMPQAGRALSVHLKLWW